MTLLPSRCSSPGSCLPVPPPLPPRASTNAPAHIRRSIDIATLGRTVRVYVSMSCGRLWRPSSDVEMLLPLCCARPLLTRRLLTRCADILPLSAASAASVIVPLPQFPSAICICRCCLCSPLPLCLNFPPCASAASVCLYRLPLPQFPPVCLRRLCCPYVPLLPLPLLSPLPLFPPASASVSAVFLPPLPSPSLPLCHPSAPVPLSLLCCPCVPLPHFPSASPAASHQTTLALP